MNKLKEYTLKNAILILLLNIASVPAYAGEHILIPKFGSVDIKDNTNHFVDTDSFDFEDDKSPSLGFSYVYSLDNGFAFGVDVFGYDKDIVRTASNRGDASISHIYAIVQKFFNNDGTVKPYIGIGIGSAGIRFDANINGAIADDYDDHAFGFSHQFFAGVEFEVSERVGLLFEYKDFNIDVNDDVGIRDVDFESDGTAIFMGVTVHI